jgi:hypothetical protein
MIKPTVSVVINLWIIIALIQTATGTKKMYRSQMMTVAIGSGQGLSVRSIRLGYMTKAVGDLYES